ncbi:PIN domain-containing protein [Ensifer sp. MJa1]|uniref:PIN domain-containing protein n=1 Tax=Ensifer sp. MJa1 TaxID=2919888 RepID=UPI00300A5A56
MDRPLRVLLDVNIWVSNVLATDRACKGTASQTLVSMVSNKRWGISDKSQLIVSFEMINTLETVLRRRGVQPDRIAAYCESIMDFMRYGPEALDPYLILGGEERFPMSDTEDAGVLATAVGGRADIIVTDNLRDFVTKEADVIETQVISTTASGDRTLMALRYSLAGTELIVAHPFDVMNWMRLGLDFTPDKLWSSIQDQPAPPKP